MRFPRLHFPEYKFTIRPAGKDGDSVKIFDIIRGRYVSLTPEEWVRQHLLHFLLVDRSYPKGLIAVEKSLKVGTLDKRFDLLVYNREHHPILLAECKAPEIPLDQLVFDQAARYNRTSRCPISSLPMDWRRSCVVSIPTYRYWCPYRTFPDIRNYENWLKGRLVAVNSDNCLIVKIH